MANLMEGLLNEIDRNVKLEETYRGLEEGAGVFGATMIRIDINRAKKAIAEGDTVEMIRTFDSLKKNTG